MEVLENGQRNCAKKIKNTCTKQYWINSNIKNPMYVISMTLNKNWIIWKIPNCVWCIKNTGYCTKVL